jgi:cytochrome c peroxidase
MSAPRFARSLLIGTVAAAVFAGAMGFADFSFGSAIIGQTRQVSIDRKAPQDPDATKAEFRRPTLIPFPEENRFTPAKTAG